MGERSDTTLKQLIQKKSLLLRQLALTTQHLVLSPSELEEQRLLEERSEIIIQLKQNDACISIREEQLGMEASQLEPKLFQEIGLILTAIRENSEMKLQQLEEERRVLEAEKVELDIGSRATTGYLPKRPQNRGVAIPKSSFSTNQNRIRVYQASLQR